MTEKLINPLAWIAFMAFVGSIVGGLIGGVSYDPKPALIGAAVGAVFGLVTANRTR